MLHESPKFIIQSGFCYVQSEFHYVHAKIYFSLNKCCILQKRFHDSKNIHPAGIKKPKLSHILPSLLGSNAGSRPACSSSFAACSFGINNFYFMSFFYVTFLNFHNTLPTAPNRNRRQFFLPHGKYNSCKRRQHNHNHGKRKRFH